MSLIVDYPTIQGVFTIAIVYTYHYTVSVYPSFAAQLIFHLGFTLNLVPLGSDPVFGLRVVREPLR